MQSDPQRKRFSRISMACLGIVSLLILYVLSSGPAQHLPDSPVEIHGFQVSGSIFRQSRWPHQYHNFYLPLIRLEENTFIGSELEWYWDLFVPRDERARQLIYPHEAIQHLPAVLRRLREEEIEEIKKY